MNGIDSIKYKGYEIDTFKIAEGDQALYIKKDDQFVTDGNNNAKPFGLIYNAKKYIDTIVPGEAEEKPATNNGEGAMSIEGKPVVNYIYFTGEKVTDHHIKAPTEVKADSRFTQWISNNTPYRSISAYDKHVGFFNGYETNDGDIYVVVNSELHKNPEYVSFGGEILPYSELKYFPADYLEESLLLKEAIPFSYQTLNYYEPGMKSPNKRLIKGNDFIFDFSPYHKDKIGPNWKVYIDKLIEWVSQNALSTMRRITEYSQANYANPKSKEAYIGAIQYLIDIG